MSGSNKVLKPNQVLFRAGDKSDGMYLIRKGELRVFLEQNGKEVILASIGAGGMIGEMSLFDQQPRSASVKAAVETEVTHITLEDFGKLMKQIPKWFVGLMSALSGRLRQTNERLQKVEAGAAPKGRPYQTTLRILNVIILLWHRDGEKDGKDWVVSKQTVEQALVETFGEEPEKVKLLLETLVREKVLTNRQDSRKTVVLAMANRALLGQLAAFITGYLKSGAKTLCLPDHALAMLRTLDKLAQASPYDTLTVALADLERQGKKDALEIAQWGEAIAQLPAAEEVKVVKTSTGPGLRTTKKDVAAFVRNHEILAALYKANLAS